MGGQLKPWDGKSPLSVAAALLFLITSLPRATKHPTALAVAEASGVAEARSPFIATGGLAEVIVWRAVGALGKVSRSVKGMRARYEQ